MSENQKIIIKKPYIILSIDMISLFLLIVDTTTYAPQNYRDRGFVAVRIFYMEKNSQVETGSSVFVLEGYCASCIFFLIISLRAREKFDLLHTHRGRNRTRDCNRTQTLIH